MCMCAEHEMVKVAVYWVQVADLSELNSSSCTQTSHFASKSENDILENCAHTVVRTNNDVCITKVYTYSTQNLTKNTVNMQLITGYHSYPLN